MARKKRSRRKPGTGAIRFKKGRSLPWEADFPLGHDEHRYGSFATRAEAEAYLDQLVADRDSNEAPRNITGGSQRVDVFLTKWLTMKQPHIKPKTYLNYRYLCNLAVGEIGGMRIDEVLRERADDLIGYFHRRGFKNVAQLRNVLFSAFQYAEQQSYVKRNPFQWVNAPPVDRRQGIALTEAQRAALLAAGAVEDNPAVPLAPLWHLYCRLGLRRGEGLGLRRSDINFTTGTITIAQQLTSVGTATVVSTPKTKKSRRTIPIPADLLDILRRHLDDQVKRAAADPDWEMNGLVFVGAHGQQLPVEYIRRRWKALKSRTGVPGQMTLHDLRHTALTILELGGNPRNVVQAIAGHASATTTGHYTDHADLDDMRRALGA